jgi:hypothetical protein
LNDEELSRRLEYGHETSDREPHLSQTPSAAHRSEDDSSCSFSDPVLHPTSNSCAAGPDASHRPRVARGYSAQPSCTRGRQHDSGRPRSFATALISVPLRVTQRRGLVALGVEEQRCAFTSSRSALGSPARCFRAP